MHRMNWRICWNSARLVPAFATRLIIDFRRMQLTDQTQSARRVGRQEDFSKAVDASSTVLTVSAAKSPVERVPTVIQRDREVLFERLGFLVVLFAYAIGAWVTWRKWPDLLVDFGEQLYLPWRISTGDV